MEVNIYLEGEWERAHTLEGLCGFSFIYLKIILSLTIAYPIYSQIHDGFEPVESQLNHL